MEYYGLLNEFKAGARGTPPPKPDCMATWDTIKLFGIPLVAGGLMDQPYEFTLQMEAVDQTARMMEDIAAQAAKSTK